MIAVPSAGGGGHRLPADSPSHLLKPVTTNIRGSIPVGKGVSIPVSAKAERVVFESGSDASATKAEGASHGRVEF
jgi:hypothetical protein